MKESSMSTGVENIQIQASDLSFNNLKSCAHEDDTYLMAMGSTAETDKTSETDPAMRTPPFSRSPIGTDPFSQEIEQQFLHAAETKRQLETQKSTAFRINDVLRNPELAAAAWQEMASAVDSDNNDYRSASDSRMVSSPSSPGLTGEAATPAVADGHGSRTVGKCAAELLRDKNSLDCILADADAEYKINCDISRLLIQRLRAGREALIAQHSFVMQLAEAEAAAANVLKDAIVPKLTCDGDPGPLQQVAAAASSLPDSLTQPKRVAAERLAAVARDIAAAVSKFKSAADALQRACEALDWMAKKKRTMVTQAYNAHESACVDADRIEELKRRELPVNNNDADPWGTLAVLASCEQGLLMSQHTQRGVVSDANEQVERLERSRMSAWQKLVTALVQTYGRGQECESSGLTVDPLAQLAELNDFIQWNSLMDPMTRAVQEGRRTAHNMHIHCQERTQDLARDLFSSTEIVRQGVMDRWSPSQATWVQYYVVLTRRGVLHMCRGSTLEGCVPLESITLRLMEFSGVSGSVFGIIRQQSMFAWLTGISTKVAFRTEDEVIASKWIVDIREQMRIWSGRSHINPPVERERSLDVL